MYKLLAISAVVGIILWVTPAVGYDKDAAECSNQLVARKIGGSLDRMDQIYMDRTIQETLERGSVGTTRSWKNPESGNEGTVTPKRTYRRPDGMYCREFIRIIKVGGRTEEAYDTACRQPDATWMSVFGGSLDRLDQIYMDRTIQETLERGSVGTTRSWKNTDSGNEGWVTPKRTYKRHDGTYCREFIQIIKVGGRTAEAYGTACRQPDGTWMSVSTAEECNAAAARKRQTEAGPRAARVSCEKWNTSGFFGNASAADVSRCLKTKTLSARNKYRETPLHMAAKSGKTPAVVATIVKAGADLNARDEQGRTPLHTAAVFGETPAVVTALIQAGADVNARDKKGRTPLQFAEKFSKTPSVVAVLREFAVLEKTTVPTRGRRVERRPDSTRVSCEKWNTPAFFKDANLSDLTRCLKTKDANARSGNGRTPLHYAVQGEKPALVTALAGAGADVNARDDRGGWTPLHLAAWFSKTPSVVEALLAAGADPTARDKAGKTPWNYAEQNTALKDTAPYRRLNEERFR